MQDTRRERMTYCTDMNSFFLSRALVHQWDLPVVKSIFPLSFFYLFVFFSIVVPSFIVHASDTFKPGKNIRHLWTLETFIAGPYAAMSNEQAKLNIGKPLDMDETRISFANETCSSLTFYRKEDTLSNYYLNAAEYIHSITGNPQEVITVIQTHCGIEGFDEFIRLSDRRLIVQIKGVFFVFTPNLNF